MLKKLLKNQAKKDQLLILCIVAASFAIFSYFDLLEIIALYSTQHEEYEIDELISTAIVLAICLIFYGIRRQQEAELANLELKQALQELKTLKGLIPICSSCKKIRDETGNWEHLESYLRANSDAEFTHSYCPTCFNTEMKEIEQYGLKQAPKGKSPDT